VNALDDGVRLEKHKMVRHPEVEHGAVVSRASQHGVVRGQRGFEAGDKVEFFHETSSRRVEEADVFIAV
jgi:hypothetical protein